jgi:hypothetical protein
MEAASAQWTIGIGEPLPRTLLALTGAVAGALPVDEVSLAAALGTATVVSFAAALAYAPAARPSPA